MPLYDYHCGSCGEFREFHPMSESGAPQVCPICNEVSERALSAPFLSGKGPNNLLANRRNDQTRVPWRTACGFGCSHAHHGA